MSVFNGLVHVFVEGDPFLFLFNELLLIVLQHIETVIFALLGEQLLMAAAFDYFSVGEEDDIVGVLNGGKSVGYHKERADIHQLFKRILNKHLGLGVDVSRCLIEDHDLGLVDDRSCKGDELSLTRREVVSALADLLVKSCRELVDDLVGVDVAASLHDLLVGHALLAEKNVASDRSREEENVLEHLSEVTAERGDLYLFNVDAVDKYLTLLNIVVAADEREDGCLSRSG